MATAPDIKDPPADPQDPPADPPAATDPPANDPADPKGKKADDPPAEDWRSRIAGDDADLLKFLGRHQSEASFAREAKQNLADIRSGKYRKPLGDDPTDDELKAYRKDFGVPDEPAGYMEALPEGLVVGDDDKPIVDEFLAAMHAKSAPAAVTAAAIETYYGIVEKQEADIAERVGAAKQATEDALREEWGADYRRNVNATQAYLDGLPEEVQEAISSGFDGKGIPLGNNAGVLKWLSSLALEANPLATVVPGAGANQASAVEDEIKKIEETMRTNRAAYNRDAKMQERLRELYGAREKLKAR